MLTEKYYPYSDPNPFQSDITEIALKNDFFSVDYEFKEAEYDWSEQNDGNNASYGGHQSWFGRYGYTGNSKIFCNNYVTGYEVSSSGCGLIAVADMFLYLTLSDTKYNPIPSIEFGESYDNIDFDTYITYVDALSDHFYIYGWPIYGIPAEHIPGELENGIWFISDMYKMGLYAEWENSTDQLQCLDKIKEMINNDIPAILSYCNNNELQLYKFIDHQYDINNSTTIGGHYMPATGVIEYSDDAAELIGRKCMIRIATYGKEYYVDFDEYSNELSFFDTNIMYVKKVN
jgi:hypothetical protein